jgi:hypothetical protein
VTCPDLYEQTIEPDAELYGTEGYDCDCHEGEEDELSGDQEE